MVVIVQEQKKKRENKHSLCPTFILLHMNVKFTYKAIYKKGCELTVGSNLLK